MKKGKIIVVGIGPGEEQNITPAVASALHEADAIVGYKYYFRFLAPFTGDGTQCVDTGMRQERERVQTAFDLAGEGKTVCIVSSGDANIYGMAPLVYEMACEKDIKDIDIEVLPGISAFQQAAALLGAPTGHDFCVVSLSDLLTPWERIERRIRAAAQADFVTAVYNPRSTNRYWQLHRLKEIFLAEGRSGNTPVGHVRNASREGQTIALTTLADFDPDEADMFSAIIIGNSQSYVWNNRFVTPRGYFGQEQDRTAGTKVGQDIMIRSFRTIASELKNPDVPLDHKWALLHAIHTTADFEMEQLLYTDKEAVARLYQSIAEGRVHTIVTDVSMVVSGIRKGALKRLGIDAKCYLNDERATALATSQDITGHKQASASPWKSIPMPSLPSGTPRRPSWSCARSYAKGKPAPQASWPPRWASCTSPSRSTWSRPSPTFPKSSSKAARAEAILPPRWSTPYCATTMHAS